MLIIFEQNRLKFLSSSTGQTEMTSLSIEGNMVRKPGLLLRKQQNALHDVCLVHQGTLRLFSASGDVLVTSGRGNRLNILNKNLCVGILCSHREMLSAVLGAKDKKSKSELVSKRCTYHPQSHFFR